VLDPNTVDLVVTTPSGDAVLLVVVRAEAWTGSDEELLALQEKLHNYVAYALDGQMLRDYPQVSGLAWRIVIVSQDGPPDDRTQAVLDQLVPVVARYGGELRFGEGPAVGF
jgi:hypothetical protein